MLQLNNRQLILDALRPAPGYRFDSAVGTSFSLDLLALMQIVLAFSIRGMREAEDSPLAKLNVLHRYVNRMNIFCHAGHIAANRNFPPLFSYFEDAIHEISLPGEGVFHPKIWLVRYASEDKKQDFRYHFLCLTRNMTFDRSWDTVLLLCGKATDKRIEKQAALAKFVAELPNMAGNPMSAERHKMIQIIAHEIEHVEFESPEGLSLEGIYPILPQNRVWPFPRTADNALFISPFVTAPRLERLADIAPKAWTLVSSPDCLPVEREYFRAKAKNLYVLSDAAAIEGEASSDISLDGLHAKLFVFDVGNKTHIFTGSANATDAAFSSNVELLVELAGESKQVGVKKLLSEDASETGLIKLLEPMPVFSDGVDESTKKLEAELNRLRKQIIQARFQVEYCELGEEQGERIFEGHLFSETRINIPGLTVRPATWIKSEIHQTDETVFHGLTMLHLSRFFAFGIEVEEAGKSLCLDFIHQIEATGIPEERQSLILSDLLKRRGDILRFLLLLLLDDEPQALANYLLETSGTGFCPQGYDEDYLPLFEMLVKALHHGPERLDEVASLMDSLMKNPAGREAIPADFMRIWEPVWKTRQKLKGN